MDKLNLMQCVVALVEEGSFTAAASRLGRSKALISTHITSLEAELGVRLLNRSTRHLQLTAEGRIYYEEAKRILEEVAQLESALQSNSQKLVGRLRLSVPSTFGEMCLLPFLAQFQIKHPELAIDCVFQDRYVDLIAEGFDLAIRIGQLKDSSLIARKVHEITLKVCASPKFLAEHPPITRPTELSKLPCIVDSNSKKEGYWQLGEQEIQIHEAIRVNSAFAAAQLAALHVGVCYCPDFAVKPLIEGGKLAALRFATVRAPVQVVYPHRVHAHSKVSQFTEALAEFLAG
ncbi:LysR family transcriptional regulator [Pseudoalteromonas fenneropenaei]|uniref:LysR family transcriptional regulator n=1 Tax=Pseudoalteromonas fenneropenaei TaxID=1737459 RepID=A0ABV7CJT9_9GAMM